MVDVTFHDAYLVESYRNDEGKPRQRTIAYLGNVRQIGNQLPSIERELFLLRARDVLSALPNMSPADQDDLIRQLHKKVPPLSLEEMRLGFKNNLKWYYQRWKSSGNAPTKAEMQTLIQSAGEGFDLWD
ncbi:MAG: hypothetical protein AAF633_17505 [Chloroflexota bacterium]